MELERARQVIESIKEQLYSRFLVKEIRLFGSVARGEDTAQSDIDLLVAFQGPYKYSQLLDLADYLEEQLQKKVDLVTVNALMPRLRDRIEKEAVRVA